MASLRDTCKIWALATELCHHDNSRTTDALAILPALHAASRASVPPLTPKMLALTSRVGGSFQLPQSIPLQRAL